MVTWRGDIELQRRQNLFLVGGLESGVAKEKTNAGNQPTESASM